MDETFDDPRVGQVVQDRYRILERLADGSMGVVYAGERLHIGRKVAIKFLHASYASDKQFLQRFERETVVMSRLAHPHCVSVIDFGVEGSPYLVMEFVSGVTLRSLLENGPLPLERAAAITRQILAGLAHAHAQGIVHRDIKPANIMLSEATGTGDHVRILDFGLATLRDAHSNDLSQTAVVVGTPNYMSPEQTLANKVDARSDIYSTGVVLFELVTGRKPFTAEDTYELLLQHRSAPVPRLHQIQPDANFPPALQDVIDRAMAKQPEDRFQSAMEFADALDAALAPTSSGVLAPIPAAESAEDGPSARTFRGRLAFAPTAAMPAQRGPRRGGSLAALVAVAIVGGAAWAGYRAWQSRATGAPAVGAAEESPPEGAAGASSDPAAEPAPPSAAAVADTPAPPPAATDAGPVSDAAVMTFVVAGDGGVALAAGGDAGLLGQGAALPGLATADAGAAGGATDASVDDEVPPEPPLPAEEQEEPVAPVTETGDVDLAEPKTETEAESKAATAVPLPAPAPATTAPAPRPDPIDTVSEAVAAIRAGRREEALRALLQLKKKNPKSAYIPYLIGNLYFEKRWWTVGMDYYRAAIRNNRLYRGKQILNQNVIRALGSGKTRRKAVSLFVYSIGRSALPYLRRAAKSDKNPEVRRWANYLVKRLTPKKKKKSKGKRRSRRPWRR